MAGREGIECWRKWLFRVGVSAFLVGLVGMWGSVRAGETAREAVVNMTHLIFSHTDDAHAFHFFTYEGEHYTISLPVILYSSQRGLAFWGSSARFAHGQAFEGYRLVDGKFRAVDEQGNDLLGLKVYDFSITRNVAQLLVSCVLAFGLLRLAALGYRKEGARGLMVRAWIEPIVLFVEKEIILATLPADKARKYTPFLLSIFFFILVNNLVGLVPSMANVTGNIAFTFTLSVVSFVVILASSRGHFWRHIVWPEGPIAIKILLIPIEIIGFFTKPFALMIRLFANMLAGHIVIICFIGLIFIFALIKQVIGVVFIPFSVAFVVFIYCIELLVACIQAYIFTNLTAVFIAQVMEKPVHR